MRPIQAPASMPVPLPTAARVLPAKPVQANPVALTTGPLRPVVAAQPAASQARASQVAATKFAVGKNPEAHKMKGKISKDKTASEVRPSYFQ